MVKTNKKQKGEKTTTKLKKGKTAPGKFLPKGTNVTKTEFKVGKIVIPKQLHQADQVRVGLKFIIYPWQCCGSVSGQIHSSIFWSNQDFRSDLDRKNNLIRRLLLSFKNTVLSNKILPQTREIPKVRIFLVFQVGTKWT